MKPARFVGNAREALARFPKAARLRTGHELFLVQAGREPTDWRPMPAIGSGACEIRVRVPAGAFRIFYVASFGEVIYVLHACQKKTPRTARRDLEIATQRYREAAADAQAR
ncbi:MAG TPA: type II toxin-antitoxin system RelE/ParE family toxin [Acidimicrobiales bacterium]|nr:type II toxin-antitoxin system RelE/ParE family toxin [Acidimicrobiales bacterium]